MADAEIDGLVKLDGAGSVVDVNEAENFQQQESLEQRKLDTYASK